MITPRTVSFREQYPTECAWLESYSDTFPFYLSLKSQLAQRNSLSPTQLLRVQEAIAREFSRIAPTTPREFSLKPEQVIQVTKWAAHKVAETAGLTRPHFALKVIQVLAETERAIQLEVRLTASRTSFCCICGLKLTNAESVIAGIGPICSGRTGVSFSQSSLAELEQQLLTTQNVTTWLPKRAVKNFRTSEESNSEPKQELIAA
jgi:hypothetical protein